jgi:hypothetical protein
MEHDDSLQCSQDLTTGPYAESNHCSTHPYIQFLMKVDFSIFFPFVHGILNTCVGLTLGRWLMIMM